MILTVFILLGVPFCSVASTASDLTTVSEKLTDVETILIDMVAQMARVKERLDNFETEEECTPACPDRWVSYKGSCYYFGSTAVTFSEAQDICTSLSAHLVHVENAKENMFLRDYIIRYSRYHYWVGATDIKREGLWKLTGTETTAPFIDWSSKEPNGGRIENCAVLRSSYSDASCSRTFQYLCERN